MLCTQQFIMKFITAIQDDDHFFHEVIATLDRDAECNYGSIKIHFVQQPAGSRALACRKFKDGEMLGPCQYVRTELTEMCQYLLHMH